MDVVNLGTFGEKRKSPASGLADALASGVNAGSNIKANKLREQELGIRQQEADTNKNELSLRKNQYELELAKMNVQQTKDNAEMGYKLVKDISSRVLGMDESMRGIFEQSPEYKEMTKVIKKYAPDFLGEDGRIMLLGKEDLVKDEMERRVNQIQQKIVSGGFESLTPGEKDFLTSQKNVGTEALAKVYTAASDDPRWMMAQAQGDIQKLSEIVKQYETDIFPNARGPLASALSRPVQEKQDPNDPLGLRGGK